MAIQYRFGDELPQGRRWVKSTCYKDEAAVRQPNGLWYYTPLTPEVATMCDQDAARCAKIAAGEVSPFPKGDRAHLADFLRYAPTNHTPALFARWLTYEAVPPARAMALSAEAQARGLPVIEPSATRVGEVDLRAEGPPGHLLAMDVLQQTAVSEGAQLSDLRASGVVNESLDELTFDARLSACNLSTRARLRLTAEAYGQGWFRGRAMPAVGARPQDQAARRELAAVRASLETVRQQLQAWLQRTKDEGRA